MSDLIEQQQTESRDADHWAQPVARLRVSSNLPPGAMNVNVNGRHVAGALQGFGQIAQPQQQTTLVDPKIQWSQWKNIWRNSAIRTGLYMLATPVRWVGHWLKLERSKA